MMQLNTFKQLLFSNHSARYTKPHLQWHITDKCNLRCTHCYQDDYIDSGLPFTDLLEILDQFRCLILHFREKHKKKKLKGHITITGGEPFARKDFIDLIEVISKHHSLFTFCILSNGTLINDDIASRLIKLGPRYIQVSLDGDPQIHDSIRGVSNFNKTQAAIQLLKKHQLTVMVSFTASRQNYHSFPQVAAICRQLNVDWPWSDRLIPEGTAQHTKDLVMSPEETQAFFQIMQQEAKNSLQLGAKTTKIRMHRALQFMKSKEPAYQCTAGNTLITIMPNGDLTPCRRMPLVVGNVFKTPLAKLYAESTLFNQLRDKQQISKGCETCGHNKHCNGGLRCLSQALYNTPFIKDPGCWVEAKTSSQLIKVVNI